MHHKRILHLRNLHDLPGYPTVEGGAELVRVEKLVKQDQAVKGALHNFSSKNERYRPHPETQRRKDIFKKMLSASALLF